MSCAINIFDAVTIEALLCPSCIAAVNELSLNLQALVSTKLVNFSISFILESVCAACGAGWFNDMEHVQISQLGDRPS